MANAETAIQNEIRLGISAPNVRMFRNNVGAAKTDDGRFITFGLCKGSSDLIGFVEKKITAEMVGKSLAVFTAIEVKTAIGKASKEQLAFIDTVKSKGGLAGIARSVDDARKILNEVAL